MMRKSAWLLSAAMVAVPTPAFAQTEPQPTTRHRPSRRARRPRARPQGAAVDNQAREQQPVDTGNIVITATRRNQALSDVPMAVSAVTADTLQNTGATDIRQLNQVVAVAAGLLDHVGSAERRSRVFAASARSATTRPRKLGRDLFIDGVYRSRTGVGLTELGPLDRIEVLRGPQGTLFGRNASAGADLGDHRQAAVHADRVAAQVDVGNYDYRRVEGSVNGPAGRNHRRPARRRLVKRDGFLKDVISGRQVNDRDR